MCRNLELYHSFPLLIQLEWLLHIEYRIAGIKIFSPNFYFCLNKISWPIVIFVKINCQKFLTLLLIFFYQKLSLSISRFDGVLTSLGVLRYLVGKNKCPIFSYDMFRLKDLVTIGILNSYCFVGVCKCGSPPLLIDFI